MCLPPGRRARRQPRSREAAELRSAVERYLRRREGKTVELYFMRHGEAEPAAAGRGDEERQLSERGRQDVLLAAQALARARIGPEAILTSPLIRARQTGESLSDALGVGAEAVEALRPGCRLGVLQALLERRGVEGVLLVGHEPDFSTMVGELIGGGQVRMQTGAVARVDASSLAPGEGTLVWLLTPAMVSVGADSGT